MLAQRAGIEVGDGGIVCDSKLRTSAPGIYAAGDCCSYESVVHGRRIHVEHWDVAMQQGAHAAGNMLGDDADYEVVPYFFSDLADWASLEYVGPAYEWDREVWRGDREERRVLGLVPAGRPRRRLPQRRSLRGTGRGAADDRRGHALRLSALILRSAIAAWCNGSTPRSGRGSRGSSPWAAACTPAKASNRFASVAPMRTPGKKTILLALARAASRCASPAAAVAAARPKRPTPTVEEPTALTQARADHPGRRDLRRGQRRRRRPERLGNA